MRSPLSISVLAAAMVAAAYTTSAPAETFAEWQPLEGALTAGVSSEVVCRAISPLEDAPTVGLPAEVPSLDWGTLDLLRVESGIDTGTAYFDHVFAITARTPGTFQLPALDLEFINPGPPDIENALTVNAPSAEIEVHDSSQALYIAAIAASVTAVVAAVIVTLRLRKRSGAVSAGEQSNRTNAADARAAFSRAKARRIEGDFFGCYRALHEAVAGTNADPTLSDELAARAEKVGYGANRPDDATLDSDFRAVQRVLDQVYEEHTTMPQPKDGDS